MKKKAKPKKPRRVVLGVGHPWFTAIDDSLYARVALTRTPVAQSILLRQFDWLPLKFRNLGNWNRIRLVAEVLK